jgi:hypothetical protein
MQGGHPGTTLGPQQRAKQGTAASERDIATGTEKAPILHAPAATPLVPRCAHCVNMFLGYDGEHLGRTQSASATCRTWAHTCPDSPQAFLLKEGHNRPFGHRLERCRRIRRPSRARNTNTYTHRTRKYTASAAGGCKEGGTVAVRFGQRQQRKATQRSHLPLQNTTSTPHRCRYLLPAPTQHFQS